MAAARFDLSIVIPAYREEKRIGKTLDELAAFLQASKQMQAKTIEVIVVAADTPDATHAIVRAKKPKFAHLSLVQPGPVVGKGRDVKVGMLRAHGASVIFMDADLATPLVHLPRFYEQYRKGSDVIIATRNLHKHHPNFWRRLLSNTGNFVFRLASGVWVEDSQCGFKMFSHRAAQICFSQLTMMGWSFDMEILAIARANGFTIVTQRVNDWVSVPDGTFAGGMVKNAAASLRDIGHIFWKRLSGRYRITPGAQQPVPGDS